MVCGDVSEAAIGPVTYSNAIERLLTDHCTRCHAESQTGRDRQSAPADVNFDTYANARESAALGVRLVLAGEMPPDRPEEMSFDDRCLLLAWLEQGLVE